MRRRRNRLTAVLAFAASCALLLSCDLSVAPGSLYNVSKTLLPLPGIVVGDTMRDSTGAVAQLHVIGYSVTGDSVTGTTPFFIVLDTMSHLVGGSKLVGDHIGKTRVVGGIASTQTLPETVTVTLSPDTLVPADSTRHLKLYNLLADSVVNSGELATLVQHKVVGGTNTTVDAVIVKYSLLYSPPSKTALPTVSVLNGNSAAFRDTTQSGRAGRTLRMYLNRRTSAAVDSAIVQATSSYRGVTIGTVTFRVIFQSQ